MSKFRDEDEFNIDEDQRYAFGEDYDLDDEDSGLDDDEDDEDYDLDEDYNLDDDGIWITEQKQKIRRGILTMTKTMIGFLMRIEESMETIRRKNRMI